MSHLFSPLILFVLIILQGINHLFIPDIFIAEGFTITIHGVFVFLLLIALYYDKETSYYSLLFAIVSGLVLDIVYTNIIGVYMFVYAVTIYFVHYLRKVLHVNFYVSSFVFFLTIIIVDFSIFWLYQSIGVTSATIQDYFENRLFITVAINYIVFLIQLLLFKRLLSRYSLVRFEKK